MPISPLDFVLLQFGAPGYYSVFNCFLLCCLQLPITFTTHLFKYYTFVPPHRCLLSGRQARVKELGGLSLHKNEWFPLVNKAEDEAGSGHSLVDQLLLGRSNSTLGKFDQCNVYIDPVHHWKGTQACANGWEYWLPNKESNLVTEFDLVCDRKFYVTILFYGVCMAAFFGAIVFGLISDKIGRTRTLHVTIYLFVASSLSAYFAVDFLQFSVFYTLQVFFISGLQMCVFVLLLEILPTPFQLQASIIWAIFQILPSLLVPILVSTIHDWRYMQLAIAVPSFAFFTYIFVIPESPLWLTVVKHNLPSAFKTLSLFGKFNGKELSTSQLTQHIQNLYMSSLRFICPPPTTDPHISPSHEHQSLPVHPKLSEPGPVLRWFLLAHFYLFFVVALLDSKLVHQHSLLLHQNGHVNAIYTAFLQLGVLILAYHLSCWLGGRLVQALFFLMDGLLIAGAIVLNEYLKGKTNTDNDELTFDYRLFLLPPMLIVIARALNHCLIAFTWYYAAKTIPTKIRATGLGFCFFWSQIAKMSVPHLIVLSSFLSHNQVMLTFGAMAILGGALTLLFSSVQERPLPNSLDDLQSNKLQCSSSNSTATFRRYPSYRDLKSYCRSQANQMRGGNIYTIPPTDGTPSDGTSIRLTTQRKSNLDHMPENQHTSAVGRNVNMTELMNLIQQQQQTSISSTSTRLGNETEKSSVSSSESNTLSRNQVSLIQMSPSTSFVHTAHMPFNPQPSYIAYSGPNLENDGDIFTVELNNEVTVESSDPVRVVRPSFVFPRPGHLDNVNL